MTRFWILAQLGRHVADEPIRWHEHSEQEARSAEAAIKAAYMKNSKDVLAMVAVPKRSWKPQTIRTETKTLVLLGDAAKEDTKKEQA